MNIDFDEGVPVDEFRRQEERYGTQAAFEGISRAEVNRLWDADVITDDGYRTYREEQNNIVEA